VSGKTCACHWAKLSPLFPFLPVPMAYAIASLLRPYLCRAPPPLALTFGPCPAVAVYPSPRLPPPLPPQGNSIRVSGFITHDDFASELYSVHVSNYTVCRITRETVGSEFDPLGLNKDTSSGLGSAIESVIDFFFPLLESTSSPRKEKSSLNKGTAGRDTMSILYPPYLVTWWFGSLGHAYTYSAMTC
jgi:hypothetical protein